MAEPLDTRVAHAPPTSGLTASENPGNINVITSVNASPTAVDTGITHDTICTFAADNIDVYIAFAATAADLGSVSLSATGAAGSAATLTWLIVADTERTWKLNAQTRYFKHISSAATGFLRWGKF